MATGRKVATKKKTASRKSVAARRPRTPRSPRPVHVFISYSRSNSVIAQTLKKEIEEINRDRIVCFLDSATIKSGEGWKAKLEEALQMADWLVCVYTGEESEFCGYEIGVFTKGKALTAPSEDSRLVCLHDVSSFPTVFDFHQNKWVELPPDTASTGGASVETQFYERCGLAEFFEDLCNYEALYVAEGLEEQRRRMEAITGKAKRVTESFVSARGDGIRTDTPTQMSLEVIVPARSGKVTAIPPESTVKGTLEAFHLFNLLPPIHMDRMPTCSWQTLKAASATPLSTDIPWVERIERDMVGVANNEAVKENDAIFSSLDKTYRAILFRHIVQWNGTHRYGIVFVQTLPRYFIGEKVTSLVLAGLVIASRFHFAYFEQPSTVKAKFGDATPDADFFASYRQLMYDLQSMQRESIELGILNPVEFVEAFGSHKRAVAEGFLTDWRLAREVLDHELPPVGEGLKGDNRQQIRAAIDRFLQAVAPVNARFLEASLDVYSEELRNQLRRLSNGSTGAGPAAS